MAVALKQTVSVDWVLNQWRGQGWSTIRNQVIKPVPGDQNGKPTISLQIDAFEWIDVSLFGIGQADDAISKLQGYIRAGGSELYAYSLFRRVDVDVLGFKIVRYRLTLLHHQVQLLEGAVFILAAAFAAIIFWQYITTGQSPALKDLQNMWGSAVTSVGSAAGSVGSAISSTYITAALALGGIAIAFGVISKEAGVKTPRTPQAPSGSLGVRAGPFSARASS
jgi:hypothetical protein